MSQLCWRMPLPLLPTEQHLGAPGHKRECWEYLRVLGNTPHCWRRQSAYLSTSHNPLLQPSQLTCALLLTEPPLRLPVSFSNFLKAAASQKTLLHGEMSHPALLYPTLHLSSPVCPVPPVLSSHGWAMPQILQCPDTALLSIFSMLG